MIWQSKTAVADLQAQGRLLIGHANDALHAVERLQTPYANQFGQPQWSSAEYGERCTRHGRARTGEPPEVLIDWNGRTDPPLAISHASVSAGWFAATDVPPAGSTTS